jgi:hypothetical protein
VIAGIFFAPTRLSGERRLRLDIAAPPHRNRRENFRHCALNLDGWAMT